jgi:hypothetical protein
MTHLKIISTKAGALVLINSNGAIEVEADVGTPCLLTESLVT